MRHSAAVETLVYLQVEVANIVKMSRSSELNQGHHKYSWIWILIQVGERERRLEFCRIAYNIINCSYSTIDMARNTAIL